MGIVHTQYMSGVLVFWHCMGGGLEGGQDRIMMSYDMVSFGSVRPTNQPWVLVLLVRSFRFFLLALRHSRYAGAELPAMV